MSVSINGTGGITFADASTQNTGGYTGFRNRIINGAMMMGQRNAGASVTPSAATITYTLDRWQVYQTSASKFSVQQNAGSVTLPVGFTNYLGVTSLAATTPGATDEYMIRQFIEGYNVSDLAWGSSSAKTITLSFQVYSSLTGTFGGSIQNSAANRCYVFSYTISVANTWTSVSVTIPGDVTGTWLTTNEIGLRLIFDIGGGTSKKGTAGSWSSSEYDGVTGGTNVIGTNGATFYITGVQLEKGSVATPFEYRPYGTELALCQRYFQKSYDIGTAVGTATRTGMVSWNWQNLSNYGTVFIQLPVRMRAAPTSTNYNPDLSNTVGGRYWNGTSEVAFTGSMNGWSNYESSITFNKDATSSTNMLIQWTASAEL